MANDPAPGKPLRMALAAFLGAVLAASWLASSRAPARADGPAPKPEPPPPTYEQLFKNWPSDPKCKLAIVFTGEMNGYLRPCGCSEDQFGGLPRRSGLLKLLKGFGMEVVPIDLGDLVEKAGDLEALRYKKAVESLKKMGYEALALGPKDFRISVAELSGFLLNEDPFQHLWGNLDFDKASKDLMDLALLDLDKRKRTTPALKTIVAGGKRIMVASVVDEAFSEKKNPADKPEWLPLPMVPAAKAALAEMQARKADLKVLLAYTPFDNAKGELVKQVPGFDLVVSLAKEEDGMDTGAAYVGADGARTLVAWAGRKGKHVAVAGYFPGEARPLRYANVTIGPGIPPDPEMDRIYGEFVKDIKTNEYAAKLPRFKGDPANKFVGAAACGKCHTKAFAKWKNWEDPNAKELKGHGAGLQTLLKGKLPEQAHNPECLKCHTLAFGTEGGFVTVEKTPDLGGNQCENCHGPGGAHSADPKAAGPLKDIRKTFEAFKLESKTGGGCVKCHDAENSLKFNIDVYWERIKHPWKD